MHCSILIHLSVYRDPRFRLPFVGRLAPDGAAPYVVKHPRSASFRLHICREFDSFSLRWPWAGVPFDLRSSHTFDDVSRNTWFPRSFGDGFSLSRIFSHVWVSAILRLSPKHGDASPRHIFSAHIDRSALGELLILVNNFTRPKRLFTSHF